MKKLEITPNYYSIFKCAQTNCPNTCCKGWTISVDNNTYNKYTKLTDSYRDNLLNLISNETKKIYMHKYYCPFLDDDMLCKIQKKYGANYVCETCREFPRIKSNFFNILRLDMLISCPEVVKIVCGKNKISYKYNFSNTIQTKQIKIKNESSNEKSNQNNNISNTDEDKYINFYLKYNEIISNILQRNKNINKRLFIYLNFTNDFYNNFKKSNFNYKYTDILNKYNKSYLSNLAKSFKQTKNINNIYNLFLTIEKSFNKFTFSNETLYDLNNFKLFSINDLKDSKKLKCFKKQYKNFYKKIKKEVNFSNLLNYYVFQTSFDSLQEKNFSEQAFFVFLILYIFKFVLFKAFIKVGKLTKEQIFIYLSYTSRAIEHTPTKSFIKETLFNNKEFDFKIIKTFLQSIT